MDRLGRSWYLIDGAGRVLARYADDAGARAYLTSIATYAETEGSAHRREARCLRIGRSKLLPGEILVEGRYATVVEPALGQGERAALRIKVRALAERGATAGERAAARAALRRLGA